LAKFNAFFTPKIPKLPGSARTYALANEKIDRCIAFKQMKGAEIDAALKAAK
jgi:hypothetical protein